jgi:N-acetylmuramoyl-L-alanine amidase
MAKFCIDPGHGGNTTGVAANGLTEDIVNLTVSMKLADLLKLNGHEVLLTRTTDTTLSLEERCKIANAWKADYFISVHHNAGGGDGGEVIHSIYCGEGEQLATSIASEYAKIGQNLRHTDGSFSRTGDDGKDYYYVIKYTNMDAVISEFAFFDSSDYTIIDTLEDQYEEARAIARGAQAFLKLPFKSDKDITPPTPPIPPTPTVMYRIIIDGNQIMAVSNYDSAVAEVKKRIDAEEGKIGKVQRNTDSVDLFVYQKAEPPKPVIIKHASCGISIATAYQMAQYVLKTNPDPKIDMDIEAFAKAYLDEGSMENIRGDLAFAQSIKETGYFNFGGLVLPEQHNYAGIGATNDSQKGKGAWFDNAQLGIRAQIQHLKAYASTELLSNECIDPRFSLVKRGSAPYIEDLAGKWAVPGYDKDKYDSLDQALSDGHSYGQDIWAILTQILYMPDEEPVKPEPPIPVPDPQEPSNSNTTIIEVLLEFLKSLFNILFKRKN